MTKQHKRIFYFIITGLFLAILLYTPSLWASEDNGKKTLKSFAMASIVSKDSPEGTWLYLAYKEAFNRLGLELDFQYYPSSLASKMADRHEVEGELARGYHYGANHPELVRVEEPGISNLTVALAVNPEIKLDRWSGLRNTNYRVDYLRGSERTQKQLSNVVRPELLSSVSVWSQGVKKLIQGKTDVFVVPEIVARQLLKKDEFKESAILTVGIMEVITIHAYLHKTHSLLASQLSETLKEMKKEGLINRYKVGAEID